VTLAQYDEAVRALHALAERLGVGEVTSRTFRPTDGRKPYDQSTLVIDYEDVALAVDHAEAIAMEAVKVGGYAGLSTYDAEQCGICASWTLWVSHDLPATTEADDDAAGMALIR
jgi:hypothetical protein